MIITNAKIRAVWRLEGKNTLVFDHWGKLCEDDEECVTFIGNDINDNRAICGDEK